MRIAILCFWDPNGGAGGVETFSAHLASMLQGARIISLDSLPRNWRPRTQTIPGFSHPSAAYRLATYFARELAHEFDCAICPGMIAWYFRFAPPSCPVVTVFHGNYAAYARAARGEPRIQRFYAALVWGRFEAWAGRGRLCVSVSESVQEQVRKHYGIESRVIYNSVDLARFQCMDRGNARSALGWSGVGQRALFIGRPTVAKGFDLVVALARHRPKLTVACALPDAPALGEYPGNLLLLIRPPRDVIPVLYSASDFLLAPSGYEGCALVPLEAMACNTPIVTSRTGMFLDTRFQRLPAGIQVMESLDLRGVCAAVDRLPERCQIDLRSFVVTHFSPQTFRENYTALLAEACSWQSTRKRPRQPSL